MNRKTNILLLILVVGFMSCSPQIRFASKSEIQINKSSFTKSNTKKGSKEADLIADVLSKMRNTANNLDDDFVELKNETNFRIDLIQRAKELIGTPYCWGGENDKCTDCSGFVLQVFKSIGVNLPRTAAQQYNYGTEIEDDDLQPGDLVFFIRKNRIGHVGIYLGNNKFIHASSSKGVVISDLNDRYYRTTYAGARRIFGSV